MKNGRNVSHLLVIICIMIGWGMPKLFSQKIKFTNLSTKQGLSHNTVYYIQQSQSGEILLATQNGFNSYNGYDFTTFYADPADSSSISNDNISKLVEDKEGTVWIGTWGGGLNAFKPHQHHFQHYEHNPAIPNSLNDNRIQILHYDSLDSKLWIGTFSGGLNCLDLATKQFSHFKQDDNKANSINSNRVWAIAKAANRQLWVGTDRGLTKFDVKKQAFTSYYIDAKQPNDVVKNRVRAICQTADGTVFIGAQAGFYRFHEEEGRFEKLDGQHLWQQHSNLSINSIYEYPQGTLWIGTQRNGLIRYDMHEETYTQYLHHPLDVNSIGGNDIRHIFVDASGVFWVGIRRGGISTFSLHTNKFTHYRAQAQKNQGLSDNQVLSLFQDRAKNTWIGTLLGGVNKMDEQGKFQYFEFSQDQPTALAHPEVRCMMQTKDGVVWLAAKSTLQRYEPANHSFISYPLTKELLSQSASDDQIVMIYEDVEGKLWLGTRQNGIFQFHRDEERFEAAPNPFPKKYANVVNDITDAATHSLWIGTEAGLFQFDKRSKTYTYIAEASHHSIHDFELGDYDVLWLGTGHGLVKFNTQTFDAQSFTEREGLPINQINSLVTDNEGFLWIGTTRGLSQFDPITESFRNYDVEDGLQGNIFSPRASYKCSDGQLLFGGENGFNAFYPNQLQNNRRPPKVIISSFSKMGKVVSLNGLVHEQELIELSYEEFLFSFEFAALDYTVSSKNQYAYRLIGLEEDWVYIGNDRHVNFNKVPPGAYTFQVKASNNDGVWNEEGVSVRIVIHPPVWKTWWFSLLMFVLIIGSAALLIYWRLATLHQAKQRLSHQVAFRTKELEEERDKMKDAHARISVQLEEIEAQRDEIEAQRNDISTKNVSLQKAIDEIQWQNREIKTQKEEIERKSTDLEFAQSLIKEQNIKLTLTNQALEEKVQQRTAELKKAYSDLLRAHKQLDHFSYRSAHDLKGPIARLLGLCYIARLEVDKDAILKYLDKLELTAKEMDGLLTRMIRTQEIKNWRIHIEPATIQELIQEQWQETSQAEKNEAVELVYTGKEGCGEFKTDTALFKVLFQNLFENAIRYRSPEEPAPKVWVNTTVNVKEQLVITVQDNGIGIAKEVTERVFDMFVVGNNLGKGAGIGLYEATIIAERLKGKIWLKEYEKGKTTFEVILPISQTVINENDKSFVISD